MASKALKIGIDVDDVVADLFTAWLGRFNLANNTLFTKHDLTRWDNFWEDLGVTKEAMFCHLTPDIYDTEVKEIEGAVQAVKDIENLGHKVSFVTRAETEAEFRAKIGWLQKVGLSGVGYGVGPWAAYKSKAEVPIDWLIDDRIGNLQDFPGYRVLVTQPHNRNHIFCGKRVKHLRDVVPLLRYPAADGPLDEVKWNAPIGLKEMVEESKQVVRQFATGATRDVDTDKLDYEAFLSPAVLERYAQFMHKNRFQKDGSIRAGDNWQKGIPTEAYMKSLMRHVMTVWLAYRKGQPLPQEEACAILFNTNGLLFEDLKNLTP